MPSHKIHLIIANEVNKTLKMDNDSILIGSVLPDLTINKDHDISHYQVLGGYEEELANPNKFVKEYKKELNNPIMMGYLIHLLTDRYYNDYFFKKHCVLDDDGKSYKVKLRSGKIDGPIKKYKKADFNKYEKYLLRKKLVPKFNNINCIDNVNDLTIATFNKEYLVKYIYDTNNEIEIKKLLKDHSYLFYKVLSKKELDNIFIECCKYIIDYINNL